jgi:hypothetical protein
VPLTWAYNGVRQNFFELAADNGRLLHKAINQSYEEVGALIVRDLF